MSISTSQAYKTMINGHVRKSHMEITITNGSRSVVLHDKDIVAESMTANGRATNNENFSLGTCYASSLNFSSFVSEQTQIVGNSFTVVPVEVYELPNNATERIPWGVFTCDNPTVYQKTTAYECYDKMLAFDKAVESRFSGTTYNIVSYACQKCGVTLGTTAQEFSRFPNASQVYVIDPDEVQTLRDALQFVSALSGAYCKMGRDGRFYVRQFHTTPDITVNRDRRISTSFGGYETRIAGVKCRFLAEQNFAPYEHVTDNEGLIIDLGDIPIVEDNETTKHNILANLYNMVLANIVYSPCEITMIADPSIEVGDMIKTYDAEGYEKNIIVTSQTLAFHKEMEIVSEGGNPKLSKVATAASRAQRREEKNTKNLTIVTTTYVNANEITVDGDATAETVTDLRFITVKDLTAIFGASIPVVSSGEGVVEITYTDSGIAGDVVKARVHEGENIITLVNHLYYPDNSIVNLLVKAKTYGVNGGSAPTLTIAQDTIRSYIFAQGIETEAPWDGIIIIEENVDYITSVLAMCGLTDGVTVSVLSDVEQGFTASLEAIAAAINTQSLGDNVVVNLTYGDHILRMGMGHRAGMGRMFAPITI